MEGTPEGNWNVLDSSDVINGVYIYPPTMLISPNEMINVLIKGTISVESWTDIDFIGLVFGYKKPTTLSEDNSYQFYLFDWRSETAIFSGYQAKEGFRLSRYNGFIKREDMKMYMWGAVDQPPVRDLLDEQYGGELGWEPFIKYDIELLYTSNRIRIKIGDAVIFDREGCYDAGKFGLYCMSQDYTRFEDFTYQNMVDFVPLPSTSCVGETVNFKSFDLNCSSFPDFVESIKWDFGDGSASTEINPEHVFMNEGEYPVSLTMHTVDGCTDTVVNIVTVNPIPYIDIGNDTILPACSSIMFDAGNPGASYEWSTGETTRIIQLEYLPNDTLVWVQLNQKGCIASDTLIVMVEPIRENIFFPNAFSPNGDGKNDVLSLVGNTANIYQYQLLVFDRWGKLVFESTDPYISWNGKYQAKSLPTGIYVVKLNYRMESSCVSGQDYSEVFTVTLIR